MSILKRLSPLVAPMVIIFIIISAFQGCCYAKRKQIGDKTSTVQKATPSKINIAIANVGTPSKNKYFAKLYIAKKYNWNNKQFVCLNKLWTKESNWKQSAHNHSSGAYGIPQSLPGSKMSSVGTDWKTNPVTQIKWGTKYIKVRYHTPCQAWNHSKQYKWY
jgi:hypothetical protein